MEQLVCFQSSLDDKRWILVDIVVPNHNDMFQSGLLQLL